MVSWTLNLPHSLEWPKDPPNGTRFVVGLLSLICIHAGETRNAADLAERLDWFAKLHI